MTIVTLVVAIVVLVAPSAPRIITGPKGAEPSAGTPGLGLPVTWRMPLGKVPVPPPSKVSAPKLPDTLIARHWLVPWSASADEVIVAPSNDSVLFFTKMLIVELDENVTLCPKVVCAPIVLVTAIPLICRVVADPPLSRKLSGCPEAGTKFTVVGKAWLGSFAKFPILKPVVAMVAVDPDGKLTVSPEPAGDAT